MATTQSAPPRASLQDVLTRTQQLRGVHLSSYIPRDCFSINVYRGLFGFITSYAVWAAGVAGIALAPHWALWIPAALLSGLGGWGLHCIAHDCGHGAFSSSRRFNHAIGQLALLPMLYPFHGWRHVHNLHHANTNNLEKDTDWRPVNRVIYARMPAKDKGVYFGTRSILFWLGTAHYELKSGFNPGLFPERRMRLDVWRSIGFIVVASAIAFPLLVHAWGWMALVKFVLLPWLGMHAWFSVTTLMHHTSEDVPFLRDKDWTKNSSKILLTTDYRYSRLLLFLTHNISIHTAHHVAPKVPFYRLNQAQAALRAALPGMVREKRFSWRELYTAVRYCHLHDPETGFYEAFNGELPHATHTPGSSLQ